MLYSSMPDLASASPQTGVRFWACLRRLSLLLALLLPIFSARATHIVGGEMELTHQTGESYTLVLNLYFDAANGNPGALDTDLTASIFDKATNTRMQDVLLPLTANSFIAYTNPACAVGSLSTRRLVYSAPVQLPARTYTGASGYYVAVERCCRNNTIRNIVRPAEAAQAFYLEFPAVVRQGQPFYDSTPRIFPPLADYACRGEMFYYDFSGRDADGDSLVYDLVTPLNGHAFGPPPNDPTGPSNTKPRPAPAPYAPITWTPGLSAALQIPGAPSLSIGRLTGRLTVRPTQAGLFVFGVRCAEYRRGEKIGETRRDFQMLTLTCAINQTPSLLVLPTAANPRPYRPGRDTLRLLPGSDHCLRLRFTDPDPNSALTLTLHPVNFSTNLPSFTTTTTGTVRQVGAPDTLTATLCFPACTDTEGRVFLLDLIVADNGCSLPRRDTVRLAFTARQPGNSPPVLVCTAGPALPLQARVGDLVTFDLTATDPDNDPLTLEMAGDGFAPTAVGATLSQQVVGNQVRGRFSWRVTCDAVSPTPRMFRFTAASTPCSQRQTAALAVPVRVLYVNSPPVLTTNLPPQSLIETAPPIVHLQLGEVYEAALTGTDADNDNLTLIAAGRRFDLAAAGMQFAARSGPGRAEGNFRFVANCTVVNAGQNLTVDFQLVDQTCQPAPRIRSVRFVVDGPVADSLRLYNIITPNADGFNDAFRLPSLPPDFCAARFTSLKIFSRWGQEVYRTTDRNFQWPGLGAGGTFFYLVEYTDGRRFKGWVEVRP